MIAGSIVLVEHKTSSQAIEDGSPFWKRLRLDSQTSNYLVGARACGFPASGVLFDVIRKPRIKPLKATPVEDRKFTKKDGRLYAGQREHDETLDEYRLRLRAEIESEPDAYYRRGVVVRTLDEERDGMHDAWDVSEQIARAQRTGRWMRNVDACERFGRFCDYFPVCTGEASIDNPTRYRRAEQAHEELSEKRHRLPLITTSGMRTFRRCAREYFYSYEQRARSVERAEALEFGTLMHVGLEVWWSTVDLDAVTRALGAATANALHLVHAEELMRGYHARWIDEPFDVLAVEREFETPLVHPETGTASGAWLLGGKIDAIARVATTKESTDNA